MVAVVAGHLGCALTLILACTPVGEDGPRVGLWRALLTRHNMQVKRSWNPLMEGKCLAAGPSFTAYAVITIISDVVVAIIPIPVLLKLKVNTGKKVGLIVIFLLGLFTTLCSVFRYLEIDRIQHGDGNSTMLIVWGVIEFNVGVGRWLHPRVPTVRGGAGRPRLTRSPEHRLIATVPRAHLPPQGQGIHDQVLGQRERVRGGQRTPQDRQIQRRLQAQQRSQRAQGHLCHGPRADHGQRGEHPEGQPGKLHHEVGHIQRSCGLGLGALHGHSTIFHHIVVTMLR